MILDLDFVTNEQLKELLPESELRKRYMLYAPGLRAILLDLARQQLEEDRYRSSLATCASCGVVSVTRHNKDCRA